MLTEDEAKKKWCPHVRLGDEQGVSASINRAWGRGCPDAARCIASECMAWRWGPMAELHEIDHAYGIPIHDHPLADERYLGEKPTKPTRFVERPKGYCGLAGPTP